MAIAGEPWDFPVILDQICRAVEAKIIFSPLVVFAAGCRTSPIYNVEDQSVISGSTRASMEDVKNAILRAGAGLSWAMRENKPGYITGTLTLREHFAVVDIKYDTQKYSILYKD